jgi:hypothetical protein
MRELSVAVVAVSAAASAVEEASVAPVADSVAADSMVAVEEAVSMEVVAEGTVSVRSRHTSVVQTGRRMRQ